MRTEGVHVMDLKNILQTNIAFSKCYILKKHIAFEVFSALIGVLTTFTTTGKMLQTDATYSGKIP
jgi:hypothetical protein